MKPEEYRKDCIELLRQRTEGKMIDRRLFLSMCAALGVAPAAFRLTPARAQANEIVVVSWGGDAIPAFQEALVDPYLADSPGMSAVVLGDGPSNGRIRAMVESGTVTWDVCDRNLPASIELGRQGLLEEIDYSIVDADKVRPGHAREHGIGSYLYAYVLTYDTEAFGGEVPTQWSDLWDLDRFPGQRTMRRHIDGMLEIALLADGVAPEDLYPLDVDRALAKIEEIAPHTIFYSNNAEAQQVFRNREVRLGAIVSTRASVLRQETSQRVDFTFNQAPAWVAAWIVPKNNPAGSKIWEFIARTQDPVLQVKLLELLGNGPINPAAGPLTPEALRPIDPNTEENYARLLPVDADWYSEESADALNRFLDMVART